MVRKREGGTYIDVVFFEETDDSDVVLEGDDV